MSVEELVTEGSVHPFRATQDDILEALRLPVVLALAQNIPRESLGWSYSIADNAVPQAHQMAYSYIRNLKRVKAKVIIVAA